MPTSSLAGTKASSGIDNSGRTPEDTSRLPFAASVRSFPASRIRLPASV